jgi:hypothetical protein
MSKKSQQYQNQIQIVTKKRVVVEPVCHDDLALFQDTELEGRTSFLIDELHKKGYDKGSVQAAPFEAELAYVQREQGIRQQRRVMHRRYLQSMETEYVDERDLPVYEGNPSPDWT